MFLLSPALFLPLPMPPPWYQAPAQSLSLSMPLSLPLPRSLSLSLSPPQTLPMLTQRGAPDGALSPPPFVTPRDQHSGVAKAPLIAHLCVVLLALRTVNSP